MSSEGHDHIGVLRRTGRRIRIARERANQHVRDAGQIERCNDPPDDLRGTVHKGTPSRSRARVSICRRRTCRSASVAVGNCARSPVNAASQKAVSFDRVGECLKVRIHGGSRKLYRSAFLLSRAGERLRPDGCYCLCSANRRPQSRLRQSLHSFRFQRRVVERTVGAEKNGHGYVEHRKRHTRPAGIVRLAQQGETKGKQERRARNGQPKSKERRA